MSGPGPARPAGRFLSRAGFRSCVAGVYLALLGNHRAHAGAGLVAGAVLRQLAGTRVENRATYTLIALTALAATLWGLRFANVLGENPL